MKSKIKIIICCLITVVFMSMLYIGLGKIKENIRISKMSIEDKRALNYEQLTEEDKLVEGTKNVEFSAFFTRDLNGDGYAEKLKGTCKRINEKDTLYAELNVLSQGYLKDGEITLNAENFNWTTALVEDNIVDHDYIGVNKSIKLKEKVNNGSQKLFWGSIDSNIGNNINNYSKINSITLTGTYIIENEDGTIKTEVPIRKTVYFTVDWYGETETKVNKYYYEKDKFKTFDNQECEIESLISEENVQVKFTAAISETNKELILQKQILDITIPKLNNYDATSVTVTNKNVNYNYDENTGILRIIKESELDEEGNVNNTVPRSNLYNVEIEYPLESYTSMNANTFNLDILLKGYNYGYNNQNQEFEAIHESDTEGLLTLVYSNPRGDVWNLQPYIGNADIKDFKIRHVVSKQQLADLYNQNVYEEAKELYPVEWRVFINNNEGVDKLILEEKKEEEDKSDEFLDADGNYESISQYINTVGIYFQDATGLLGNDGWIKLYDGKTGLLLETFYKEDWEKYDKNNLYNVNLKTIKIETSKPINRGSLGIFQIKEIDNNALLNKYDYNQFEKLLYMYTYLKGTLELAEGYVTETNETTSIISKSNYAYYEMDESVQELTIIPENISNQKTENVNLKIDTKVVSGNQKAWKNGVFLIEMPEEIINLKINDIELTNESVKINNYYTYEENGKQYIKIFTKNIQPQTFTIIINADITANPLNPTKNSKIKLYGFNENCNNYSKKSADIFDLDKDGNVADNIGCVEDDLTILAPSGLLTAEYVSNYDDKESITIAPNIADIEKADETRTATINVSVTNNYSGTISETKILGKIPFEGNTYILTNDSLNSKFNTSIVGRIKVPETLKDYTTIYYSEKEDTTKDLSNANNMWKTESEVEDWSKIKTYLILLGDYKLQKDETEVFSYEVEVPVGLNYNTASYSDHAVYYCLDTENGKLETQTEPNKVGIAIVSKYKFELTKNKKSFDNILVKDATYKATTLDVEGKEISVIATTNEEGKLLFKELYFDREYTLEEVDSPDEYMINNEIIKFKAVVDEEGKLKIIVTEGNFKEIPEVIENENLIKAKLEDEVKFILNINKKDSEQNNLENVKFRIISENIAQSYKTDSNGKIEITGLNINEEYELEEIEAEGYYVDTNKHKFKIVRDNEGNLKVDSEDAILNAMIITEREVTPIVELNLVNEKIPTYNLEVIKVEENLQEEDTQNLIKLANAKFLLNSIDKGTQEEFITNIDGKFEVNDLFLHVENKPITGEYTIRELKAPEGYSNNIEEVKIKVTKNENNDLEVDVQNRDNLKSFKDVKVEGNTVKLYLQDKPLFRLTKVDSKTGEPLKNVKFIIYEVDDYGRKIDYAKDVNGNYVGELNEKGQYIVVTDNNGNINLPLRGGKYKTVEVEFLDGYEIKQTEELFEISNGDNIEPNEKEKIYKNVEINTIEDLVDLSIEVNNSEEKNYYYVKLNKTLDFNEDSSYRNPNIKTELTSGIGFTPIGNRENLKEFRGIFDGNGNEIRNIYINSSKVSAGLFGYISDATIENIGVTGEINGRNYVGGIVGLVDSNCIINKCYNKCNLTGKDVGGICGASVYDAIRKINSCYNTGNITAENNAGGIIGNASSNSDTSVIYSGRIANNIFTYDITNCYNRGSVTGNVSGGIVGYAYSANKYDDGINRITANINNCYNTGDITGVSGQKEISVGAIIGNVREDVEGLTKVENCYYLSTITISGDNKNNYGERKTAANMKSVDFVDLLNPNEYAKDTGNINNGYPILNKQRYIEKINYVEDLLDLSIDVDLGYTYEGRTVILNNNLDFNNIYSYNDYQTKKYGDLNENGTIEDLKTELTTGKGFLPIGNNERGFAGIFDGQEKNINNIYINREDEYTGLFSKTTNAEIKNVKMNSGVINGASSGGIVGYAKNSNISNCTNNCEINGKYQAGGIAAYTYNGNIERCYNTGDVHCYSASSGYSENSAGGIAGDSSSTITECYNTGKITCESVSNTYTGTHISDNTTKSNAGGIVGKQSYGSIKNSYNNGDIECNALCNAIINNNNNAISYLGGIAGYTSGNISNCYNTGFLNGRSNSKNGNTYVYEGGVVGNVRGNAAIVNNYYLDSIKLSGIVNSYGDKVTSEEMKSLEFYNDLNTDLVWNYRGTTYNPVLATPTQIQVNESTQVTIENDLKELKITTDVYELDGVKGGSITGEDMQPYETVDYNGNNTKEIIMIPDEGYNIISITVNGEEIEYTVDNNGTYTIGQNYFTNMNENKHIVVAYAPKEQILKLKKIDKDTEESLEGATFKIERIDDGTLKNDEIKEMKNSSDIVYLNPSFIYYFEPVNEGFVPNNLNVQDTQANSFLEIDLSNDTDNYELTVNIEGKSKDAFWGLISERTAYSSKPERTNNNLVYYIDENDGNVEAKDYSIYLQGGKKYYLNLGYKCSDSEDTIKINKINFDKVKNGNEIELVNKNIELVPGTSNINNTFEKVDGKYVPKSEYACSKIEINLEDYDGSYEVIVNAGGEEETYGFNGEFESYIVEGENTPAQVQESDYIFSIKKSGDDKRKDYSKILQGGKKYTLYFEYSNFNENTQNTVNARINSIRIKAKEKSKENKDELTPSGQYYFIKQDGVYIPNNLNLNRSTTALSYKEIDLTNEEGDYQIIVSAEGKTYLPFWAVVTENEPGDSNSVSNSAGNIFRCTNSTQLERYDYSYYVKGGKKYYVTIGYNSSSRNNVAKIYDIRYEKVTSELIPNGRHSFTDMGDYYSPSNLNTNNNLTALAYREIDLTNSETDYELIVNAEGKTNAPFWGVVTENTPANANSHSSNTLFYIVNNTEVTATDYKQTLTKGKKYYLNFGYIAVGTDDKAKINAIILYKTNDGLISNGEYYFVNDNGAYIPNNLNKANNTCALSYKEIDLTNEEDDYEVIVNVEGKANAPFWAIVTQDEPTNSSSSSSDKRFIYIQGRDQSAKNYRTFLEHGKKYYLNFGYFASGTGNTVKINRISIKKAQTDLQTNTPNYFIKINGIYVPSNLNGDFTSKAISYKEIDLTDKSGYYKLTVNTEAKVTANYLAEIIEDNLSGNKKTTLFSTGGNNTINGDYSSLLEGGKKYYLRLEYMAVSNTDSVKINNIKVEDLGNIINDNYYFEYNNGGYVPNNLNMNNNSTAYTHFKIDLTNNVGNYKLTVNARGKSYKNCWGTVTENAISKEYIEDKAFMNVTSNENKDYNVILQGGKIYYLNLAYKTNSTTDEIKINSIQLQTMQDEILKTNAVDYFLKKDGYYAPRNNNAGIETKAEGNKEIDLTDKEGNYKLVVNAELSGKIKGYVEEENSSNTKILFDDIISTSIPAKDYSVILQGGKKYNLKFEYIPKSNGDMKINSINLYEVETTSDKYYFRLEDEKYVSTNKLDNTVSHSYIPLDLRNTSGKFRLKVNAEISSEDADYGYAIVSEKLILANYKDANEKLISISGEVEAKDYETVLNGGKLYYLHLIYDKNSEVTAGEDIFKINNIGLTDYYTGEVKTDKNGEVSKVLYPGRYKVTEINAPKGYSLNNEPQEVLVEAGTENETLVFRNAKQPKIIVHHYYKDKLAQTPEEMYTTKKVAEDEIYTDEKGEKYETSPRIDLQNLSLQKDENGKYIIPENAIGVYGDETIEISYYYELEPIELTIHHYIEGTQNKLAEDKVIKTDSTISFDENGNYEITTQNEYSLKDNEDYINLIDAYNLTSVESTIKEDTTIEDILQYNKKSEITYYYIQKEYEYTVHYFYDGIEDVSKLEHKVVDNKDPISEYEDKIENGYRFEKVKALNSEGEEGDMPLQLTDNKETNVINVYYVKDNYNYEVRYFYDGDMDNTKTEKYIAENGSVITDYKDKIEDGYVFQKVRALDQEIDGEKDLPLIVGSDKNKNVINVYYVRKPDESKVHITTSVIEHTEVSKSGVEKTVKGGTISGEDEAIYEEVTKNNDSTKEIIITPDEGYQVAKIIIKQNKEDEEQNEIDFKDLVEDDGKVVLKSDNGFFKNMESNKHVEVEFRKNSKVIVKYLSAIEVDEEGNPKVLAEEETIEGYEGKDFNTSRKTILNYIASDKGVTDELEDSLEKYSRISLDSFNNANGKMYSDTVTIIYWYDKILSGIIIKHIEITEEDRENGLTQESGKLLDFETLSGYKDEEEITTRNTYDGYVSVDGYISEDENIISVKKEEDEKSVHYIEDSVVEVIYYYEKQFNITTEVKLHNEDGEQVKGGTISGENAGVYEKVYNMGSNKKEIKITPDEGYRVKLITINNRIISESLLAEGENGVITIDTLTKIDENIHIVVEFEAIPKEIEPEPEPEPEKDDNNEKEEPKDEIEESTIENNEDTSNLTEETNENEQSDVDTTKLVYAKNVKTGDTIFSYVTLFILSIFGIIISKKNKK